MNSSSITYSNTTKNETILNPMTNDTAIFNSTLPTTKSIKKSTSKIVNNNVKRTTTTIRIPKNKGGNYRGNKRPNFPPRVTQILKNWLLHNTYPFPTNTEKDLLSRQTGLKLVNIYIN